MGQKLPHGKEVCQLAICQLALVANCNLANMADMANRIRDVRKSKHMTLEELAEAAGISVSYLSRVEGGGKGTRGLSLEMALRLARALQCEVPDITDDFSVEDIEHGSKLDLPSVKRAAQGDIPNLTIHAGLGNGGVAFVETNVETGIIPDDYLSGFWSFPEDIRSGFSQIGRTHALPVKGDSMEPTLPGGSTVFVDTSHILPSPPDLYAVDYGDGLMVKRVELIPRSGKVRVISDNQRYQSYEMDREDLRVYGRVVASFQWRG
jgi:transcriptional regulator with XRE-family HTH domain